MQQPSRLRGDGLQSRFFAHHAGAVRVAAADDPESLCEPQRVRSIDQARGLLDPAGVRERFAAQRQRLEAFEGPGFLVRGCFGLPCLGAAEIGRGAGVGERAGLPHLRCQRQHKTIGMNRLRQNGTGAVVLEPSPETETVGLLRPVAREARVGSDAIRVRQVDGGVAHRPFEGFLDHLDAVVAGIVAAFVDVCHGVGDAGGDVEAGGKRRRGR